MDERGEWVRGMEEEEKWAGKGEYEAREAWEGRQSEATMFYLQLLHRSPSVSGWGIS